MTTMNISLPDEMKAFVDTQMQAEGYASASEYLRTLIREAQRRKEKAELEERLLEGVKNPLNSADIDWDELRREAEESIAGENIRP